jgi:hypothetical protein
LQFPGFILFYLGGLQRNPWHPEIGKKKLTTEEIVPNEKGQSLEPSLLIATKPPSTSSLDFVSFVYLVFTQAIPIFKVGITCLDNEYNLILMIKQPEPTLLNVTASEMPSLATQSTNQTTLHHPVLFSSK